MRKKRTDILAVEKLPDHQTERPLATGIHCAAPKRRYVFDDMTTKVRGQILIGRSVRRCDIGVKRDKAMSLTHGALKRLRGGAWELHDFDSTNGIYVDNRPLQDSVLLTAGMVVQMGETVFIALDDTGAIEVSGRTISEFCRNAAKLYGSCSRAAAYLDRSTEYIRQQKLPRHLRVVQ